MFICEKCKKSSSHREKENKVVVETRTKVYPDGNFGTEIVKEISVCSKCMNTRTVPKTDKEAKSMMTS